MTCASVIPFLYDTGIVRDFGKNCLYSILGVSNIYYIKAYSDYFAIDANMNPLLHTWFLSTTIQIYALWAIGAVMLQRYSRRVRQVFICFVALASFIYSFSYSLQQIAISWDFGGWGQISEVSYYDPVGRLWQIFAGGLILILPASKKRGVNSFLFVVGLLIIASITLCNQPLPIYSSIMIVAGTVLVLRYAGESKMRILLENKPLLFLGSISFSLYLIHFPLFVFYKRWERTVPDFVWGGILLIIAIAGAWALWRWIESRRLSRISGFILFSLAMILTLLARGSYRLGWIWNTREVTYPAYELTEEHVNCPESVYVGYKGSLLKANGGTTYMLGAGGPMHSILSLGGSSPQFVLVGNSVAQELYAGFHEICKKKSISGIHLTTIIYPMWNYREWQTDSYCWTEEKADAFIEWLSRQPDIHTVVVSYLWKNVGDSQQIEYVNWNGQTVKKGRKEVMLGAAKEFCNRVKKVGKHVLILTPTPVFMEFKEKYQLGKGEDYVQWRRQRGKEIDPQREEDPFVVSKREYMEFNKEEFAILNQLEREGYCDLLHIEQGIFQNGNFPGLYDGTLFCMDRAHITPPASIYIMQEVADEFETLILKNKHSKIDPK